MGRGTQERVCIPRKKVNADENAHFFLSSRSQSREHAQSWTSFCYIKRRLSPLRKERGEQHLFQRIGTLRVWTTYCVCLARVWVSEHEENKPEGNWELRKEKWTLHKPPFWSMPFTVVSVSVSVSLSANRNDVSQRAYC